MLCVPFQKTKSARTRNSRLLIERFESRIPGFNRFSLSFSYWLEVCDAYGIRALQRPMRLIHGLAMQASQRPYIVINTCLPNVEKIIAIGHEFTHIIDQELDTSVFLNNGNLWNTRKYQRQAWIIGIVGLMPETVVEGLSIFDLMRQFGVRREIAEFRVSVQI